MRAFVRLACRAPNNPISPGFVLEQGSSNAALIAAHDLIQSVYLPKGARAGRSSSSGGAAAATPSRSRRPHVRLHAAAAAAPARTGTDDSGGVGPNETDWTIFTTLRDHTKSHYYYRVANSPSWSVVKLSAVNWAKLQAQKAVGALLMLPKPWWALDVSALAGDSSDADATLPKLHSCLQKCVGGKQDAAALTTCVATCV